jgi:riboflavin kinase/FMN adenylyltransferase
MRIVESIENINQNAEACALTIGNFDGVHLGHQHIISTLKKAAERYTTAAAVMTFQPHPAAILHPEKSPGVLTLLPLKAHLLESCGVDILVVVRDNPELLELSPQAFVAQFVMEKIKPIVVVEGENFHFGRGRAGNIETLRQLGAEYGFEVLQASARQVRLAGGRRTAVSSSRIREWLHKGCVKDAAVALSRPYRLIGQVIPGRGRGAKLGFPTANLKPSEQIIPARGVYAGFTATADTCDDVCRAEAKTPAAFSIGGAETFPGAPGLLVEAHILADNIPNLYGKWLAMDFVKHLRNQRKFKSEDELIAQIAKDCRKAGEIFFNLNIKGNTNGALFL